MENMEEQQKLAELMMKNILELGRFSYNFQEKREESLINQSGRMLTAYSVAAALLPLLLSKTDGLGPVILFTGLLISFIFAVIAGCGLNPDLCQTSTCFTMKFITDGKNLGHSPRLICSGNIIFQQFTKVKKKTTINGQYAF